MQKFFAYVINCTQDYLCFGRKLTSTHVYGFVMNIAN
jgi:hypothetical protein